MAPKRSWRYQTSAFPVTVFAHLVALSVIVMVLVWLLHFREGLAFKSSNKNKIFNVHPLLMFGFILVAGEAMMAYKTVPVIRKRQKLFHLLLHLIALAVGIIGIYAVFKYHHETGDPDMYTLHSWLGMSTICLFGLQWLFSFLSFWYPKVGTSRRARLAPWHAVLGLVIFSMAVVSAELGLTEKFISLGLRRNQESLIVNFMGLLILLFAIAVSVTVFLPKTTY